MDTWDLETIVEQEPVLGACNTFSVFPCRQDGSWGSCAKVASDTGMLTGRMPRHRLQYKTLKNERKKTMFTSTTYLKLEERKLCQPYTKT